MSAVTEYLPHIEQIEWTEFRGFDEATKENAIVLLREAGEHVERLTLRQAVAQAARDAEITDASVWAAYLLLWQQIRDGHPHSMRELFQPIDQWEADQGWVARSAREMIRNAIDAYHTTRIDHHAAEAGIYAEVAPQVATGKLSLADAALQVEHNQAGT